MKSEHLPSQSAELENLSAFIDGEYDVSCVHAHQGHERQLQAWEAYHLIGEVVRGEPIIRYSDSSRLLERLRQELASEVQPVAVMSEHAGLGRPAAANGMVWRWVAGVSVLAISLTVGWKVYLADNVAAQPALAQLPIHVEPGVAMIRNPELDALLAQHRQQGGMVALQAPVGFLRAATYGQASDR